MYDLSDSPLSAIELAPHARGDVHSIAFSEDSRWLAISTSEGVVSVRSLTGDVANSYTVLDSSGRFEASRVSFSPGGKWVLVISDHLMIGRRKHGATWEEVGSRYAIEFPCESTEWLPSGEEVLCIGKRAIAIVALGTELIDGRLAGLIGRALTDEEKGLFNIKQ